MVFAPFLFGQKYRLFRMFKRALQILGRFLEKSQLTMDVYSLQPGIGFARGEHGQRIFQIGLGLGGIVLLKVNIRQPSIDLSAQIPTFAAKLLCLRQRPFQGELRLGQLQLSFVNLGNNKQAFDKVLMHRPAVHFMHRKCVKRRMSCILKPFLRKMQHGQFQGNLSGLDTFPPRAFLTADKGLGIELLGTITFSQCSISIGKSLVVPSDNGIILA